MMLMFVPRVSVCPCALVVESHAPIARLFESLSFDTRTAVWSPLSSATIVLVLPRFRGQSKSSPGTYGSCLAFYGHKYGIFCFFFCFSLRRQQQQQQQLRVVVWLTTNPPFVLVVVLLGIFV